MSPHPTQINVYYFHSSRAVEFHAKDGRQLAEWFTTVGLDMYTDIVERNLSSGEQLVTMVTANNNAALVVSEVFCSQYIRSPTQWCNFVDALVNKAVHCSV